VQLTIKGAPSNGRGTWTHLLMLQNGAATCWDKGQLGGWVVGQLDRLLLFSSWLGEFNTCVVDVLVDDGDGDLYLCFHGGRRRLSWHARSPTGTVEGRCKWPPSLYLSMYISIYLLGKSNGRVSLNT
jgi:hypothetical protein